MYLNFHPVLEIYHKGDTLGHGRDCKRERERDWFVFRVCFGFVATRCELASPRPALLSPYRQACHPPLGFLRCPSSCSIPFHPPCGPCSGSSKPSPGILTPLVMTIIEYIQTPNQRPPGVWLFPPGPLGRSSCLLVTASPLHSKLPPWGPPLTNPHCLSA